MTDAARWLRDRADSYARDAFVLRSDGHQRAAVCYETIRDELRRCAKELETAVSV